MRLAAVRAPENHAWVLRQQHQKTADVRRTLLEALLVQRVSALFAEGQDVRGDAVHGLVTDGAVVALARDALLVGARALGCRGFPCGLGVCVAHAGVCDGIWGRGGISEYFADLVGEKSPEYRKVRYIKQLQRYILRTSDTSEESDGGLGGLDAELEAIFKCSLAD